MQREQNNEEQVTMIKNYQLRNLAVLVAGMLAAGSIQAAELKSLEWKDSFGEEAIIVGLDETVQVQTEELDGGKRLRVSFPSSDIANIAPLEGKGIVTKVTPVKEGKDLHIDLATSVPAHLSVISTPEGYRITTEPTVEYSALPSTEPAVIPLAMTAPAAASGAAGANSVNTINDISFSKLSGGRVQVKLKMDSRPEGPASFITKNPSRIALDFFNTASGLEKSSIPVKEGALDSITAIQVEDRTRLVLNLLENVSYETVIEDDGLVLVLNSIEVADAKTTEPKKISFAEGSGSGVYSIENIDFRRGKVGEGNIIISLSDPSIGIDIDDEAGTVTVDFGKTGLPEDLERRLDVIDFATPIQTIDTYREGKGTRMVVSVTGQYEQLAYQTGNVFTLSVRPLTKDEIKEQEVDEFGYSGERLSLNFQKIDVRSALQVIADFTGLNIVTSDTVKGNLTLRLQDVPWDQALDLILRTKGLAKREKGNVVWIAPAREVAKREKEELEAQKKTRELEPLVSEVVQVNYANASAIARLLKSIKAIEGPFSQQGQGNPFSSVSVGEIPTESNSLLSKRGNVTVDKRTNTLLIQDTASKIKEVRKLIAQLDQPVKQVMIETRIVEALDDWGRTLGARLGVANYNKNFNFPHGSDNSAGQGITSGSIETNTQIFNEVNDTDFGGGDEGIPTTNDSLNVNLPSTGLGNFLAGSLAFSLSKFLPGYGQLLNMEITALEAEGKGKIIASPRIITANNEEAHIEQGQERIFTTNVLGVGSVVTKKAVLGLTVTPHITPDNRVIMDVFITKDDFESPVDPTINTKQIETQILLDNGETAVIGGIYQESTLTDLTKIPLLGDIPGLGVFFRNKTTAIEKTELLFFLTPKIITPSFGFAAN